MTRPNSFPALLVGLAMFSVPGVEAQTPDSLPAGVTAAMIADGAALYKAQGLCFACHGQNGKGMPNMGADLTDNEWTQGDGSYEAILTTIEKGAQSRTGAVMPPNGGSSLNETQRKAVAAYVWTLSRTGTDQSDRRR